jgi:hypothetical protein
VSSIPLGTLFEDTGSSVFVPLGQAVSPPVPPDVLRQLARVDAGMRLFVTGGRYPIVAVPENAFVAATRLLVADVPVFEDAPIAPPLDADRPLPDLWPAPPGLFAGVLSPGARGALPQNRNNTVGALGAADASSPPALPAGTPTNANASTGPDANADVSAPTNQEGTGG